jgi:hypothetical protein
MKNEINKQSLVDFVDPNAVLIRYPPETLKQRTYTFVPGTEAYGEVIFIVLSCRIPFLICDLYFISVVV